MSMYLSNQGPIVDPCIPGMPLPGDMIETLAATQPGSTPCTRAGKKTGKNLETLAYATEMDEAHRNAISTLLYCNMFPVQARTQTGVFNTNVLCGHKLGSPGTGPVSADVMLLVKSPHRDEVAAQRYMQGEAAQLFWDAAAATGTTELFRDAYVTAACPYMPTYAKGLQAMQQNDGRALVYQQLGLVKPKLLVCLGVEGSKQLFGSQGSLAKMQNKVAMLDVPIEDGTFLSIPTVVITSPAAAMVRDDAFADLQDGMRFVQQVHAGDYRPGQESDVDYRYVTDVEELNAIVDAILSASDSRLLAIDGEWEGERPTDDGAYLRTIQFSHSPGFGVCVVLREQGGRVEFMPGFDAAAEPLRRLFLDKGTRLVGQFLRADAPWLNEFLGIDVRAKYAPAIRLRDTRRVGGQDTGLMMHSINSTSPLGLEGSCVTNCRMPRWDAAMRQWANAQKALAEETDDTMRGYGEAPGNILYPYGCGDVDGTLRLAINRAAKLDFTSGPNATMWRPYYVNHGASIGVLEMEDTGFSLDENEYLEQVRVYSAVAAKLLQDLRDDINWPDFNPGSSNHRAAALFGRRFGTYKKFDKEQGRQVSEQRMPDDAITQNLTPIATSNKPSIPWERVVANNQEDKYNPSTDKQSLGVLGQENDFCVKLLQYRQIATILTRTLRPPESDVKTGELVQKDGGFVYTKGLMSFRQKDYRVRTRLRQTTETGRAASKGPNLQNLCYDAVTEILTARGWVLFRELLPTDLVAEYDETTEQVNFVQPLQITNEPVAGDHWVELTISGVTEATLRITPNHRQLVTTPTGKKQTLVAEDLVAMAKQNPAAVRRPVQRAAGTTFGKTLLCEAEVVLVASILGGLVEHKAAAWDVRIVSREIRDEFAAVLSRHQLLPPDHVGQKSPVRFQFSEEQTKRLRAMCAACYLPLSVEDFSKIFRTMQQLAPPTLEAVALRLRAMSVKQSRQQFRDQELRDVIDVLYFLGGQLVRSSGMPQLRGTPYSGGKITKAERVPTAEGDTTHCVTVPSGHIVVRRNSSGPIVSGNSKRMEDAYKEIAGDLYRGTTRSVFHARPGYVIVEADYTGAELCGLMWQANDPNGIEDVRRNLLPSSHPDHYDIHSHMAVRAFNLTCPPTKKGLKDAGCPGLRVAAKNVIFGIPYGRGDAAIAMQCREEGTPITREQAAAIREYYFSRYAQVGPYLEECRNRVDIGWMMNAFGRLRVFNPSVSDSTRAAQQREAQNYPIQSLVADAMWLATRNVANLLACKKYEHIDARIALTIHDALLLEVRIEDVPDVVTKMLPEAMVQMVSVRRTTLDGEPATALHNNYRFGIDTELMLRWGVSEHDAEDALGEGDCDRCVRLLKQASENLAESVAVASPRFVFSSVRDVTRQLLKQTI